MGVSRYRRSSRSFVRDTGNVPRDSSRVSGRVAVSGFVASAARVRGAKRGGRIEITARARAAPAWPPRLRRDGRSGARRAGPAVPLRAAVRARRPGRRARALNGPPVGRQRRPKRRKASGRQGLVGCLHSRNVAKPGDLGQPLQQPGRDQRHLVVDAECDVLARDSDAGERRANCSARARVRTSLLLQAGTSTAPRPSSRPRSANGMRASPLVEVSSATRRTRATVDGPTTGNQHHSR